MGHKTRDAALDELNDSLDVSRIHRMLDEIGYDEEIVQPGAVSQRLVAYYTSEAAVEERRLREHLARHLPESMMPAHFVAMQALPLTDNGKIDRAALPVPVRGRPAVESVYRAPRSELEKQLAGIWHGILDVGRIGTRDNYYALGGDSIAAIQIASMAQDAGLPLAAIDIFEHLTIEALAVHLAARRESSPNQQIQPEAGETPEPFSLAGLDKDEMSKVAAMLARKPE
jgi:hypothetical protein